MRWANHGFHVGHSTPTHSRISWKPASTMDFQETLAARCLRRSSFEFSKRSISRNEIHPALSMICGWACSEWGMDPPCRVSRLQTLIDTFSQVSLETRYSPNNILGSWGILLPPRPRGRKTRAVGGCLFANYHRPVCAVSPGRVGGEH